METMDLYKLRIRKTINDFSFYMLRNPNIVGVARGNKVINGYITNIPSLTLYVEKKLDKNLLNRCDIIPQSIKGVSTDVIESGSFQRSLPKVLYKDSLSSLKKEDENRPALGGGCIFYENPKSKGTYVASTLTYAFTEKNTRANVYFLTSEHLVTGFAGKFTVPMKYIGSLKLGYAKGWELGKIIKVSEGYWSKDYNGVMIDIDAALGIVGPNNNITRGDKLIPGLLSGKIITSVEPAQFNDKVYKYGISTLLTTGRVVSVEGVVKVKKMGGAEGFDYFNDQTQVNQPSSHGDSGSLGVVESTQKAFGMLNLSTSQGISTYSNIQNVLDEFKIELLI